MFCLSLLTSALISNIYSQHDLKPIWPWHLLWSVWDMADSRKAAWLSYCFPMKALAIKEKTTRSKIILWCVNMKSLYLNCSPGKHRYCITEPDGIWIYLFIVSREAGFGPTLSLFARETCLYWCELVLCVSCSLHPW